MLPSDDSSAGDLPTLTRSQVASSPERIADRYEILGLLGVGGMGAVYRVRDTHLDEVVALKFLRGERATPEAAEQLRDEVRIARRVTHPHVARTFDCGVHDGSPFLTMELVEGESLARVIQREAPVEPARLLELVRPICQALTASHEAGVVHLDLKPANVLIGGGRVVVSDFGIARRVRDGQRDGATGGTPAYMAPEQAAGLPVDARTDLYALGVVLHELLTGSRVSTVAETHRFDAPGPRRVAHEMPDALGDVVRRCLEVDPDQRYPDARSVESALLAAVTRGRQAVARSRRPTAPETSLAVLPFAYQGPDGEAWLADALTDEIADLLVGTATLRVKPRSLVRLQDHPDPCEVGRALGVDCVVEGSVRRVGPTLRVRVRVIGVSDGFQLWARRFDLPAGELLQVVDEVAEDTARALASDLRRPERQQRSPEATEVLLRARHAMRDTWNGGGDAQRAIRLFEEALRLSPDDAEALAGLAATRLRSAQYGRALSHAELDTMERLVTRALDADPDQAEAWVARGLVEAGRADIVGSVRAYQEAIQRAPGLAKAHELLARVAVRVDALETGIVRLEAALGYDPTLCSARAELGRALGLAGRWQEADRVLDHVATTPGDQFELEWARARLALWRRRTYPIAGIEDHQIERLLRVIRTGRYPPAWQQSLTELASRGGQGSYLAQQGWAMHADFLALTGQHGVLDALDTAVGEGLYDPCWLTRSPLLEPHRDDPRYLDLVRVVQERARPVREILGENL